MTSLRDVRCPSCNYMAEDVRCSHDDLPPCPECGTTLVTSWHSGQAPGLETVLVFKPLQVQGVTLHSKAEEAAFLAKANRRLGPNVGKIALESVTPAQRRVEVDETRHENFLNLKNHGISPADVKERRVEVKAKKQEKQDARNA